MKDFKYVVRYNKQKHEYELFKRYRRKWNLSEFKYRDISVENEDVVIDYKPAAMQDVAVDIFKKLEISDYYGNANEIFYFVFHNLELVGIKTDAKYEDVCALIETYTEYDLLAFVDKVNEELAKQREAKRAAAQAKKSERTL